jgi:hypothetical protein
MKKHDIGWKVVRDEDINEPLNAIDRGAAHAGKVFVMLAIVFGLLYWLFF